MRGFFFHLRQLSAPQRLTQPISPHKRLKERAGLWMFAKQSEIITKPYMISSSIQRRVCIFYFTSTAYLIIGSFPPPFKENFTISFTFDRVKCMSCFWYLFSNYFFQILRMILSVLGAGRCAQCNGWWFSWQATNVEYSTTRSWK